MVIKMKNKYILTAIIILLTSASNAATITGTSRPDTLTGTSADDTIAGLAGNDSIGHSGTNQGTDSINGGTGDDEIYCEHICIIYGNDGVDHIVGGSGADTISGENDNDRIWGNYGNDIIYGNAQDDFLSGEQGDDTIYGGFGNDTLEGGTGNDSFMFNTLQLANHDLMSEFSPDINYGTGSGGNDVMKFDISVYTRLPFGVLPATHFKTGTAPSDANDYIVYDNRPLAGKLWYYPCGNVGICGDPYQIADLPGAPVVTYADIVGY